MPIGIVELGIEGLTAPARPATVDGRCRTDLVTVDGQPFGVSIAGTTDDLLAGRDVTLTSCDGSPLTLPAGSRTIRTAPGALTGFDLDRLVLRSAAGGGADTATGPVAPADPAARPKLTITAEGRTSFDATVARADEPFWLVLGQSHNLGWKATVDGHDLGAPTLVDGYANGWMIPAGTTLDIHVEWTPQRMVWAAIWASVVFVLGAVVLVAWPSLARRRATGTAALLDPTRIPLDARPSMTRPLDLDRILRFAGPRPSRFALEATTAGALVVGGAVIGPVAGLALGLVAATTLRIRRARPLLTLGGPLVFALCVGWLVADQVHRDLPAGFDWPTYFDEVHQWALSAVGLLVLDPIVDRCWLRRWWLTDDSPS
jgi:arabinofuranan 3-O-arabinosyltransferase